MPSKKILICDDDPETGKKWKRNLSGIEPVNNLFTIATASTKQLNDSIAELEQRRKDARKGDCSLSDCLFDDADVVFVDYDLLDLDKSSFHTGETVAYLLRCYSRCGIIISVNQFGVNNFDLTLSRHPDSFADIHLGDQQLDNPGLWTKPDSNDSTTFRPWYWPVLPNLVSNLEARVADLDGNLDIPIVEYFDFPDSVIKLLPHEAIEFIEKGEEYQSTHFERFVRNSGSGLREKDEPISPEFIRRIAASRIATWLEDFLLSSQHYLADAPHLIGRYPALMTNPVDERNSWDRPIRESFGNKSHLGISYKKVDDHYFEKHAWLSRHAWFGREIRDDESLSHLLGQLPDKAPDLVFAEDCSQFVERTVARAFVADLPGPHTRRWVRGINGVNYSPQVRLTL